MAERVFTSPPLLPEQQRRVLYSNDSDSLDDSVMPRRQKEIVKMRYSRRRKRLKKRPPKTQSSSSESETTRTANKSLELLSLREKTPVNNQSSLRSSTPSSIHTAAYTVFSESNFSTKPGDFDTKSLINASSIGLDELEFIQGNDPRSLNKATKERYWYSSIFGNIFTFMSNRFFSSRNSNDDGHHSVVEKHCDSQLDFKQDFIENTEELCMKVLERVVQFCPEQYLDEINQTCVLPLKHKLNQRGVTIGICGESQYGKELLMKTVERRTLHETSEVGYRLCCSCPLPESSGDSSTSCNWYFLLEQATCAAHVYILSPEDRVESIESLKWLIDRDRDIVNQGRVLFLVDSRISCSFDLPDAPSPPPSNMTPPTSLISTTTAVSTPITISNCITTSTHVTPSPITPSTLPHQYTSPTSRCLFPHSMSTSTVNTATAIDSSNCSINKQQVKAFIEGNVGVTLPSSCLILSSASNEDNEMLTEEQIHLDQDEITCSSQGNGVEFEAKRIESLTDSYPGLTKWLEGVTANCDSLRQLSITSDALHCIEYCCNRLRYLLEDISDDIYKSEQLLTHKAHAMMKLKQTWRSLDIQAKEAALHGNLGTSYGNDIKATVTSITECVLEILERFQNTCMAKLERLSNQVKTDCKLFHLFRADVDAFTSETIHCLEMIHANLLFFDMLSTLQDSFTSMGADLEQLEEDLFSFEASGDVSSAESVANCQDNSNAVYPCSLETMGCDTHLKPEVIREMFYSILRCLALKNNREGRSELKKLRRQFVSCCSAHLESEDIKAKCIEYHVQIMSGLISKRLEKFQQLSLPQFKDLYHQHELRLADLKKEYEAIEARLKHLINLKVYLELSKSQLSYCLKQ